MTEATDERNDIFGTNWAYKISPFWNLGQAQREGIYACFFIIFVPCLLLKILSFLFFCSQIKMMLFRTGIYIMLVQIANRECTDQTLGLRCLSEHFTGK